MTLDEITSALKSPDAEGAQALRSGVTVADELAPLVFTIAERFCRGVYLLPAENRLLFHGLHILAAARHPELLGHVLALARQPEEDLDRVFPGYISTSLTRLLLSVWDLDADALFAMIQRSDLTDETKWAWFDVLARLTFDGRIPRARTIAFLDRLEREGLMAEDDYAWWAWEKAVTRLGIKELEPALRRAWSKAVYGPPDERDRAESLDVLNRAAAEPTDPRSFDQAHLRPIEDPVEAEAWVGRRADSMAKWDAEHGGNEDPDEEADPAEAIRLTPDEQDWLAGFLRSRQAPDSTITFEMLDGLFTALVIGPSTVMPSEYLPAIWGTDDGAGPVWEDIAQSEYFLSLIERHWNAIAARTVADAPHHPFTPNYGEPALAHEWAEGFALGVELCRIAWEPMLADRSAAKAIMPIFALIDDDPEVLADDPTPAARAEIVNCLPALLQIIASFWRRPSQGLPHAVPLRSKKVGRNEPCPCGSGKKFKKCCGGTALPTLQ